MIRVIVSASIKTAVSIIFFFMLIFAFLILLLFSGLNFERVSLGGVELKELYLKIDKRAIIRAESLTLQSRPQTPDKDPNLPDPAHFRWGFIALYLLEELRIDQIHTPAGSATLRYENGQLHLDHDRFDLTARLGWMEPAIAFELESMQLNAPEAHLTGRGLINPFSAEASFDGVLDSPHLQADFKARADRRQIAVQLNHSDFIYGDINGSLQGEALIDPSSWAWTFDGRATDALAITGRLKAEGDKRQGVFRLLDASSENLQPLANFLPVPDTYRPWISGHVLADRYEAEEFRLAIDFEAGKPLFDTLYLQGSGYDGTISFNPDLNAAVADRLDVFIINDELHIQTHDAHYEGIAATAHYQIQHLTDNDRRHMRLEVETEAVFDSRVRHLLAGFNVPVQLEQHRGENQSRFILTMDLTKGTPPLPHTRTDTRATNLHATLYGIDLFLSDLALTVDDRRIIFDRARLDQAGIGTLEAAGELDFESSQLQMDLFADEIHLLGGLGISMSNLPLSLEGHWGDEGVELQIPELKGRYTQRGGVSSFYLEDLLLLRPHTPLMELLDVSDGQLGLHFNGDHWRGDFDLQTDRPLLYYSRGEPILQAAGHFERDEEGFLFSALDGQVALWQESDLLRMRLDSLGLDTKEVLRFYKDNRDRIEALGRELEHNSSDKESRFFLFGNQSELIYGDRRIGTDWFSLFMEGTTLEGQLHEGQSTLMFSRRENDIILRGERLSPRWVNEAADMKMSRGSWDISAHANLNTDDLYGVIRIRNASFHQARFVSNLLALINTLPALAQFRSPGFSADGFSVQKGVIEFYLAGDHLFFNAIRLVGESTDIIGQGSVNLKSGVVDFSFSVQTVKAASSLISRIPLIGYLLLGDDEAISTVLRVEGTLDKPRARSQALQETAFYPLSVIGRTLSLPFKLFEPEKAGID